MPVAGATRFECLSKPMCANQLLGLLFCPSHVMKEETVSSRHFFPSRRIIIARRWWVIRMRKPGGDRVGGGGCHKTSENNWITHVVDHGSSQVNNSRVEASQIIDLMLHSCGEEVHKHYTRSTSSLHDVGLRFSKCGKFFPHLSTILHLEIKETDPIVILWQQKIRFYGRVPMISAPVLWTMGCNRATRMVFGSIRMNTWSIM